MVYTRQAKTTSPVTETGVLQEEDITTPAQTSTPDLTTQYGAPPPSSPPSILRLIEDDIKTLSEEGKAIVSTIIKALQIMSDTKDQTIEKLQTKIEALGNRILQLEDQLDDVNQYERRDTIIVGGSSLPQELPNENSSEVIVRTIKEQLKINITQSDINIAHRIGNSTRKPIIVKLHSRQKKEDIMSASITIRPNLHINESLTPKRRALFKQIWEIRKKPQRIISAMLYKGWQNLCKTQMLSS